MTQCRSGTSISGPLVVDFPLWTFSSVRFQILMLIAAVMAVFTLARGSLSMALVCMIEPSNSTSTPDETCSPYKVTWSVEEQAQIHTSFYFGALLSVFLAGYIVKKYGAKNIVTVGLLVNVLGSIAIPFSVIFLKSSYYIMIIRFLMGFGYGILIPCGSVMVAKWFPISEKSTAMALFTTGCQVGIAGSMVLTAEFCQMDNIFGGWPLAFLLYGIIGLVFCVIWIARAAEKPRNSKYISAAELEYILGRREKRKRANTIMLPTPYKKIFASGCVLAICLCSFAQSFIIVGMITYLPAYYQSVLKLSINNNGIWSSAPFIVQMITKILFGTIADRLKKKRISASLITKGANAIASFGTAFCILLISFLGAEDHMTIMLLMCISMGLLSGYVAGYNTSIVSVAPQFTAFISSYAQIYSQAASTIAPYLLGNMTAQGTEAEWKLVFYLLAAVLIISGIAFQFIGHGHSESWGEVGSANPSIRLSMASVLTVGNSQNELPLVHKTSCIDDLNAKLLAETEPPRKRTPKVSYSISCREDEVMVPLKMEDIENDCITEEDES